MLQAEHLKRDNENPAPVCELANMPVAPQHAPAHHVVSAQALGLLSKKDDQMLVEDP